MTKSFIVAAICCSLAHSKILRNPEFEIVRGQGFAAPPPGHQSQSHQVLQELLQQQHQDPPSSQHAVLHSSRPKKPIRIISEFDKPGSFQPMKFSYQKENYEPTTEKSFVSGPPLGDDFFEKYMEKIKRSRQQKKKQKLSFAGLLPSDLVDRRKRKPQDPPAPVSAFYQIKAPVILENPSSPLSDFNFNPNGKWYGEKASGLLQPPTHNIKHRQVTLDFISPSIGAFSPNTNWFGEKATGLFSYPNHLVPKRESVDVTNPSKAESKENFSPSGWHVYRNKVIETGTRSSLYSDSQEEPAIITLDNVAKYLNNQKIHSSGGSNPDVFDVNVQAVIKTRDTPKSPRKFYV